MKTIIKKTTITLTFGLLLSLNISAKDYQNTTIEVNSISDIKKHIVFPNFIQKTNHTDEVKIVFTINESGNIDLVIANTSNEILKKSIEQQFLKLKFPLLKTNITYGIQFNFKTV